MARITKREVKGIAYAYLEEDYYYGSKREVLSVYLGPMSNFSDYDSKSKDAEDRLFLKIIENSEKSPKFYRKEHLNENAIIHLEFARILIRIFYSVTLPDEIKNYAENFYTRYTQGTTGIEGNTCTLRETDLILNEGISVGGKELREIYEIENYKRLRVFVDSYKGDISEEFIKNINRIVMEHIEESGGTYRRVNVAIRGAGFEPIPSALVETEMTGLIRWYNEKKNENLHPVEIAALFHQRFEEIHPFKDGNGRTGRELLNSILRKNGFPTIFFGIPEREQYLKALDYGNEGNHIPLVKFITWRIFESAKSYGKQVVGRYKDLIDTATEEEKTKIAVQLANLDRQFEDTIQLSEDSVMKQFEKKGSLDR